MSLLCRLVSEGVLAPQADIQVPEIPMDLASAVKLKKVSQDSTSKVSEPCER
jgi:hypothetical protein